MIGSSQRRLARHVLAGLTLLVLASCRDQPAASPPASLRGTNLLVITLDTTRRDHISAYDEPGYEGLTPEIDELAESGALLLNAYSQHNSTNPAHTSLFTGTYGLDNRIMNNLVPYAKEGAGFRTLAEAFQRAGYQTAEFAATPHVSSELLALPGFDHVHPPAGEEAGDRMVDRFLGWLDARPEGPFFAWLHFFDPHAPYAAPPDYQAQVYRGDPTEGEEPPLGEDPQFMSGDVLVVHEQFAAVRDRSYPPAMYRAEVRFLDDQIGRLLEALEARSAAPETAVVLIADHGESLGEHGIFYSHLELYEPSIRIPFAVRLPGFPKGLRISDLVSQIDLLPTLAELYELELDPNAPVRGVSLADALRGEDSTEASRRELLVIEDAFNRSVAVRRGRWKAIFRIHGAEPPVRLFDLAADPDELRNVAHEHPEIIAELQRTAVPWLERGHWSRHKEPIFKKKIAERLLEKRIAERLRALGYIPEEGEDDDEAEGEPAPEGDGGATP